MNYFLEALGKYAIFSGRSRRSEYWFFVLFTCLIATALALAGLYVAKVTGGPPTLAEYLVDFFSLLVFIPSLAVSVRRLHDVGMSGWWILLNLVPFGSLVVMGFSVQDSQAGDNKYGPNPKEAVASSYVLHSGNER
ncbi:MAG: DUF805 domain-containing protein [Candidatus Cybelea sp.]